MNASRSDFARVFPYLLCGFATLLRTSCFAAPLQFSITDLNTLGGAQSHAYAINGKGDVVGDAQVDNNSPPTRHAFLYRGGVMTDLGTLGGTLSVAQGINNQGEIVGYSTSSSGYTRAFLFSEGGMTDLGTLGGTIAVATAINN